MLPEYTTPAHSTTTQHVLRSAGAGSQFNSSNTRRVTLFPSIQLEQSLLAHMARLLPHQHFKAEILSSSVATVCYSYMAPLPSGGLRLTHVAQEVEVCSDGSLELELPNTDVYELTLSMEGKINHWFFGMQKNLRIPLGTSLLNVIFKNIPAIQMLTQESAKPLFAQPAGLQRLLS